MTVKRDLEFYAPSICDGMVRAVFSSQNPFTPNNKRAGAIFIHIPKNAGRSVYEAALNEQGRHIPLKRYYTFEPELAERFLKFAVVRHPVDRFVSAFNGLKGSANGSDEYSSFVRRHIDPFESVEHFGDWMSDSLVKTRKVLGWLHFWPQYKWVSLKKRGVTMDEVLHFESLSEDWPSFAERNGFSQDLPTVGVQKHSMTNISSTLRVFLRKVYARDFRLFGYE